jgi:hypothetical protein
VVLAFSTWFFLRGLRVRWPWLEWTAPERPWVGFENPCNEDDMEFFYAMTNVTIGNSHRARFLDAPWAYVLSPKSIAPSIYSISKKKVWSVRNATTNAWIMQIDTSNALSMQHLQEFVKLWEIVSHTHLVEDTPIGSLPLTVNTLALRLIMHNLWVLSYLLWTLWFGRIGLHQSAIFCLANHSK